MATSGTRDSKLLRPDPLLLLPMLEDGEGDFPYSWNLNGKRKVVSVLLVMTTLCSRLLHVFSSIHLYGW